MLLPWLQTFNFLYSSQNLLSVESSGEKHRLRSALDDITQSQKVVKQKVVQEVFLDIDWTLFSS